MKFAFMAGLPRSGSTLLSAIFNQRVDTYSSNISESSVILRYIHLEVPKSLSYQAGSTLQRDSLLKNLFTAMYSDKDVDLVIDKSRNWGVPYYLLALEESLGDPPKIISPVRPLKDIVASFIIKARENENNYIDRAMLEEDFFPFWRKNLDDARVDWLLSPNGHLGMAMLGLHGAFVDETKDMYHLVSYKDLCANPSEVMEGIECFLNIGNYKYDFNNIVSEEFNDSEALGIDSMHKIKSKIFINEIDSDNILSDYAINRCELEDFWTKRIN